ncbi:MAG: anti-sigma factor [Thermoanaerobaculia bacterium]|nr:anti-sigma factor [Thermoanaerobaculia bacterium]
MSDPQDRGGEESSPSRLASVTRFTWISLLAALLFLSLWAWAELRLRAARDEARSIAARAGALESEARPSVRDRIDHEISKGEPPRLEKVMMSSVSDEEIDAEGRIYVDPDDGRVFGFIHGLDPSVPGMTYQLWYLPDDAPPEGLGRLVFDEEGEAVVTSTGFPAESTSGEFSLTLEHASGALAPTGREILQGNFEPGENPEETVPPAEE